jgi:hypothetical protein
MLINERRLEPSEISIGGQAGSQGPPPLTVADQCSGTAAVDLLQGRGMEVGMPSAEPGA